jgi:cell division protein FtsW (lipid II flippase)
MVLKRILYLDIRKIEHHRVGENYIMRSFIIMFLPYVLMMKQNDVGSVCSPYDTN